MTKEFWLLLGIGMYIVGAFLIPRQNFPRCKHLFQQEYTYHDDEGKEHEAKILGVNGIGSVLTYRDVYLLTIPFFVVALVVGRCIYGTDKWQLEYVIFTNCIIGVLLVVLTSRSCLWSTLFYWGGIVMAGISNSKVYER